MKASGSLLFVSLAPGDALRAELRVSKSTVIVTTAQLTWQRDLIQTQIQVDPYDEVEVLNAVQSYAKHHTISGVLTFDEKAVVTTAAVANALQLPSNRRDAAYAARNKYVMRRAFTSAGLHTPRFALVRNIQDAVAAVPALNGFPVVIKPLFGSASEGVLKLEDYDDLCRNFPLIKTIAERHKSFAPGDQYTDSLLLESFLDGHEIAVDAFVTRGTLSVVGVFDKPDPLNGPTFEESIYVSPSGLPTDVEESVCELVHKGASALGLTCGPVHAEIRLDREGPTIVEIGARPIGGVCGRTHTYRLGFDYHEAILRCCLDQVAPRVPTCPAPAGVMMLGTPRQGRLLGVTGVEEARAISGVLDVFIMARPGAVLRGLPEDGTSLGFIFATGATRELVIDRLRTAKEKLQFSVEPL